MVSLKLLEHFKGSAAFGCDLFGDAFDDANTRLKRTAKLRDFDCVHSIALKWQAYIPALLKMVIISDSMVVSVGCVTSK